MASAGTGSSTAVWCYPIIIGLGLGFSLTCLVTIAQLSTPPALIAITSGLLIAIRSVGGAVGLAICKLHPSSCPTYLEESPYQPIPPSLPIKYLTQNLANPPPPNQTPQSSTPPSPKISPSTSPTPSSPSASPSPPSDPSSPLYQPTTRPPSPKSPA